MRIEWASLRPKVTEGVLADIARRITDSFHPQQIVLFGSYAYGEPDIHSDLDLLVVMDSDEPIAQRIRRVAEVARVPFLPMDVLVYTSEEITERVAKGDPFITEVLQKGKVLYSHDTGG